MTPGAGRSAAAHRILLRAGALTGLLFYALLSLNLADFKPASRPAPAEAGMAAAGPVRENGIPVPGAMGEGGGHKCCCKHAPGGKCAMGCCGSPVEVSPREACFHECPGEGPVAHESARLDHHLVPVPEALSTGPATAFLFPLPVQATHSPVSSPPEKIPIA